MPTVYAIIIIAALMTLLVAYAVISQTIQRKRARSKRWVTSLKSRLRSFQFMLSGCPDGFLTKELMVFVQRGVIDAYEQLITLEPLVASHAQNLQKVSQERSRTQPDTLSAASPTLKSAEQIKEAKMSLEALQHYVLNQEGLKHLTHGQADVYRAHIKQLALRIAIETYELQGQQANQNGKIKLALHCYEAAYRLLVRNGNSREFEQKTQYIHDICAALTERLSHLSAKGQSPAVDTDDSDQEAQIAVGTEPDDEKHWQKKQVYD